ncbi:zinc finger protein on ecdysone puffs [Dendroctonus ponderosae]|uniref:C2H2-type domain-containing protein n=1 Tax=Dendroctonus ponderosae TaxID=77166 RepID=A0AAR5PPC3_DENPD|nr:zinc finger protein on ecdysone puffs [Dendroctonus ponderosae]KAH1004343.1 hypothetical protein HUJ04_004109 [Dendroctonus ponderosae]KAH1010886.1 hypothetical protein HUJ05_005122 [Dendroctonus ponderosae]
MNRRFGGGQRGGNRGSSFSQQPFQSGGGGVNPWQGGGSNMNQGGILSQLTSNPQLALALTSLLQPQQQPPSLLSLNTSPAFSGNRDYGRFNSGFNRGRDINRRHEPYNKQSRGGGFIGNDRRRRPSPKREIIKKKPAFVKVDKKEESADANDEADEEKKESKRDWKEEKNNVEGKESGDDEEAKKEVLADSKDGKYGGIDKKYLHCWVCNKQMWDGESMSKHVRGRAHHEMLKALEESIHICVNILRENLRLQEERKLIEFNRQSRQRKFNQRREPPLSHCAMCDLKFMGKIISHRRTDGHQRLKRYLHPNCRTCDKEYPSRIEWIEHCLTPEHLRRSSQVTESKVGGKDGDEIISGEESGDINMDDVLEESLSMEGEDPIIDIDDSLINMVDRLPAYKKNRPVAVKALQEFTGFKCDLCNRSFAQKSDADAHLTTRRHFYRFVESIKERFDSEEKRKRAEKDAAEKSKPADVETTTGDENGVKVEAEDEEEDGDQEMYDPTETTEDEKVNEEEAEENVETVAVTEDPIEEMVQDEVQPEPEPAEVKAELSPPVTRTTPRKAAGPKSKRGRK